MHLDLIKLQDMHPLLAPTTVADFIFKAAIGLGRKGHQPGIKIFVSIDNELIDANLSWEGATQERAEQLDRHRVTEEAAEAISLALVFESNGWVVRRRMQKGEFGDWLLVDKEKKLIVLEVSGIDGSDGAARRMRQKVEQVRRSALEQKAICVVELSPPRSTLTRVR